VALGVNPGDTFTARELYKRIGERIPTASVICTYETDTSFEWTTCGGAKSDAYEQGLALTLEYLKKPINHLTVRGASLGQFFLCACAGAVGDNPSPIANFTMGCHVDPLNTSGQILRSEKRNLL
jgi:hypothetical protein